MKGEVPQQKVGGRCGTILRGVHSHDEIDELVVEQGTARALITLEALLKAVQWSPCEAEMSDALWVTPDVLACRLRHLHPAERAAINDAAKHHVA